MILNPFKKVNAAADNANRLVNETREAMHDAAAACERSCKAAAIFQGIKAACSLVVVGLVGFIAYQVGTDK